MGGVGSGIRGAEENRFSTYTQSKTQVTQEACCSFADLESQRILFKNAGSNESTAIEHPSMQEAPSQVLRVSVWWVHSWLHYTAITKYDCFSGSVGDF